MQVLNTGLLKSPSNWFLVTFTMIIVFLIFHFVTKDKS